MFNLQKYNYDTEEVVKKITNFKDYYGQKGGVTLSGGEPLLQPEYLIELCKKLKKINVHIALDTAGYGIGKYEEILKNIDLIILDIKDITEERFKNLTNGEIQKVWEFLKIANKLNKKFIVRQVIVPDLHYNKEYLIGLNNYIKKHIKNIQKIEFLPYHKIGDQKYEKLKIPNPYKNKKAMDIEKCNKLFEEFMKIYNNKNSAL